MGMARFTNAFLLVVLRVAASEKTVQRSNIIAIIADDLGFRDVGWHGSEIKTPVLDGLVRSGIDLSQWHGHSICTPSRAALMTGRYAFHTGMQHSYLVQGAPVGLPLNITTIADGLKKAGYSTHMIGKWHLGFTSWEYTPLERGFDTYFGYLGGGEDYYTHESGGYVDLRDNCAIAEEHGNYSASVFVDKAVKLLRGLGKETPFFLYLAFQSVHSPIEAPPYYTDMYLEIQDPKRRTMAQMVSVMDAEIGRLVHEIKDLGIWETTLLFFAADNGGPPYVANSNWPLRGGKWTMWQGGAHVAAFVTHGNPSVFGVPREFPVLAHHMDLLPTLFGAAGVSQEFLASEQNTWRKSKSPACADRIDGINLWPYWTQQRPLTDLRNRSLVLNVDQTNTRNGIFDPSGWAGYAGIHTLEWKLMLGDGGTPDGLCWPPTGDVGTGACTHSGHVPKDLDTPHLYHLSVDPSESFDVADQYTDVVLLLSEELQKFIKSACQPLNMFPDGRRAAPAAQAAAQANGAWTPWEKCTKKRCRCESVDGISTELEV